MVIDNNANERPLGSTGHFRALFL